MSAADWKNEKLQKELQATLGEPGTPERGGLIFADGSIVELENGAPEPDQGAVFDMTPELLALLEDAVATWHTHPGATANLSVGDNSTFCAWPDLQHAIVGTDGVRWYAVKNGAVINA